MVYLPCFDSKLVRLEIETALARLMMPQLLAISFDSRLVRLKAGAILPRTQVFQ